MCRCRRAGNIDLSTEIVSQPEKTFFIQAQGFWNLAGTVAQRKTEGFRRRRTIGDAKARQEDDCGICGWYRATAFSSVKFRNECHLRDVDTIGSPTGLANGDGCFLQASRCRLTEWREPQLNRSGFEF